VDQVVDRPANRDSPNAVPSRKVEFGRDLVTRSPFAAADLLVEPLVDLQEERLDAVAVKVDV